MTALSDDEVAVNKTPVLPASHVTSSPGDGSSDHLCPTWCQRHWSRWASSRCPLGTAPGSLADTTASTRTKQRRVTNTHGRRRTSPYNVTFFNVIPYSIFRSRHEEQLLARRYNLRDFTWNYCIDRTANSLSVYLRRKMFLWPRPLNSWPWKHNQFVARLQEVFMSSSGSNLLSGPEAIEFTRCLWPSLADLDFWSSDLRNVISATWTWYWIIVVISFGPSASLCCCHWLRRWYWRDSTTAAQPWLRTIGDRLFRVTAARAWNAEQSST